MTDVAAALICAGGKFLICQRPAHKVRGLLWEFPGGKAEPGETLPQTLIRECREELAVTVRPGEAYWQGVHVYPDLTIRLTLFCCTIEDGAPQKLEHSDLRWITPAEIGAYAFCPADQPILQKLLTEGLP